MTTKYTLILLAFLASLVVPAHAQIPQIINYQGRVAVGTVNFDGSGTFKFALDNAAGTTTYWSTAGSQPTVAVTLTVTKGLYSVLLGDTALANMTAIPNSIFVNADVRLRVWFNDGTNGSQLLTPDQRIAAVGYAMVAGNAANFTGSLAGDVTGTQGATVVGNVGGITAANVATGVNAANALTGVNLGTGSPIFSSRSGTNLNFRSVVTDSAVGREGISLTSDANTILIGNTMTGVNVGSLGLGTSQIYSGKTAAGMLSFRSLVAGTNVVLSTAGNDITISAATASGTSANTPNALVQRDGSGNFSAGTITASLAGNATTATTAGNVSGIVALANGGTARRRRISSISPPRRLSRATSPSPARRP